MSFTKFSILFTSSKPIMTEEVPQKLNGVIGSQRDEIHRALARDEQKQRDQQLLHEQYWNKIELHEVLDFVPIIVLYE